MKRRYVIAACVSSIFALPAYANIVLLPDATVIPSPGPPVGFDYTYSLTPDPSVGAMAGTVSGPDTSAGSGFVTLNYFYAVVGPALNPVTYVPVTITGSVNTLAGGIDGESEASINYANGGVDTQNYGPGVLSTYGYSYAGGGTSATLNATYDVLTSYSVAPTPLEITLYADVNAGTGGQAHGTSSASAGADPIITLSPALLAQGYSIELSPNLTPAPVPLPSTWWMLLTGMASLGVLAHRATKGGSATTDLRAA